MKPEILGRVGAVLACLAAGPASAQAPRLGTIDFPTAGAPAARAPFIRGVLLLHSFEYGDAARAFREAQVFYALSLLGLNQGVRDVPTYLRAAAIVDTVFRENPNHPGAAHLLIHSYDDPIHAPLGLAAARAYSKIAPDAAHAQHM